MNALAGYFYIWLFWFVVGAFCLAGLLLVIFALRVALWLARSIVRAMRSAAWERHKIEARKRRIQARLARENAERADKL